MVKLVQAESKEHLSCTRELFNEYVASLNFNLCFQIYTGDTYFWSMDSEMREIETDKVKF